MQSFRDVFEMVSEYCKGEMSNVAHNLWISCLEPLHMKDDVAYLFVGSEFQKNIVEEKYMETLKNGFRQVLGFDVEIDITTEISEEDTPLLDPTTVQQRDRSKQETLNAILGQGTYEYTFDTFIVGPSNKFAHAATLAVATSPSAAYNPLFIHGDSGLGKTHLLYAICNEIERRRPGTNILYVKGEEFTNELIAAISEKNTNQFHQKYRSADVLLMDDVQFIGGKESTQEEFFHTFNSLYHSGKQIVLTSDRPPKEIKTLEERLRTRFEWGLLADVQTPDYETRIAIIRRKAELLDIALPDDVTEFIANKLKNNIRQLEGAVKKLRAYMLLDNTPPTIIAAQNAIKDILNDNQPVEVTVERIIGEVGRTYGISAADIRSNKRSASISAARQVSMYVVREITQMSMVNIGEEFGGRDHSTVVYAINQTEKNMRADRSFKETVGDIIKNLRS